MLKQLLPICNRLILVNASEQTGELITTDINILHRYATEIGFNDIILTDSISDGVKMARNFNQPTLICGSFFIMAAVATPLRAIGQSATRLCYTHLIP
jgi:hypothetical protein